MTTQLKGRAGKPPAPTPKGVERNVARSMLDRAILGPAILASVKKLDPRRMVHNPVMFVVGIGAGLLPSFVRRSNVVVTVLASVGVAIPTFVAAMILIQVFALDLGWFPTTGSGSGDVEQRIRHLTLPAIAQEPD